MTHKSTLIGYAYGKVAALAIAATAISAFSITWEWPIDRAIFQGHSPVFQINLQMQPFRSKHNRKKEQLSVSIEKK
jgi:hypothetical protein